MPTSTCNHCGTTFRVARAEDAPRAAFCCAGCGLRAKVPIDGEGNFPVNGYLIFGLVIGFAYFNQLLGWGMHGLLLKQEKLPAADGFARAGVIAALFVWFGVVSFQWRLRALRAKDTVVAAVALVILGWAIREWPPAGGLLAAANAILLIWNFRGIFRSATRP